MVYFSVSGNSLTGNLPASMSEWKYVADFEVNANKFDGQLPAINYAAITHTDMSGCFLLDQPVTNRFSCPFPPGVTEKCLKNNDGGWVPITNADCHVPPTFYACIDNQCVARAGGSLSKGACAATCTPAQLYACTSNTCVKSDTGVTQAVCEANCGHTLRGTGA